MKRQFVTCVVIALLAGGASARLFATDKAAPVSVPPPDAAMQKRIDQKVTRLIDTAKVTDADKVAKVRTIGTEWFTTLFAWHQANDAQLNSLWTQWNQARSVVPKDEFPGEIIATRIEEAYASLRPAYEDYIKRLSAELTPEQIDAVKEAWSRSPGMKRTYNSYLEIVPDLSEKDKEVIKARLHLAREAAMLTDSDREIVNIFKRHKVKVEQYVGTLEWAKLHSAFAKRGTAAEAAKKAAAAEKK